jgi:biopolymer transport protein ExbD
MRLAVRILLILTVLSVAFLGSRRLRPQPAGIYVGLPPDSPGLGFGELVLGISKQHSIKINYDRVPIESLAARLNAICGFRYKCVVFVRADPDISFQEVMDVIDVAQGAVADVQLVLVTPRMERNMLRLPEGSNKLG